MFSNIAAWILPENGTRFELFNVVQLTKELFSSILNAERWRKSVSFSLKYVDINYQVEYRMKINSYLKKM